MTTDRRSFLKVMGAPALAASLPVNISRALEIPAHRRTGTINDVEHIIILTQENRSFDHYFGAMRGVRGFADPRAVRLPSGLPVWHQPNGAGVLLPFRPDVENMGDQYLPDPPHGWNDTHAAWNAGQHDRWVPNKGISAMTHYTRRDLPYHYALADAFTVCDAYHCSVMGPTDPNRYHMWTGWVGNDGQAGGPVITNAELGYDWSTYPERLQRAGISWKVYQDSGVGLDGPGFWGWTDDPFIGNYGDNSLLYFHQYQTAPPGSPLAESSRAGTNILSQGRQPERLLDVFRADVRNGTLPRVSWIAAPEAYSEHPNWPANFGAWYISQFVDILSSNPDVMSKTVLFVNYDEEGGFFDHMVPPTPPQTREQGLSTVPTTDEIFPGDSGHPSAPYGLGMRVPLIIVSPWTKGGWVNSQVFDHTSLIRFIEARFAQGHPDLIEQNITPWRRAVAGDLTSAFDFANPESWRSRVLPATASFKPVDLERQADDQPVPPATQAVPAQERGVRPARALPYALHAHGLVRPSDAFRIEFANVGRAAAVFHVRSGNGGFPRTYTVEPPRRIADSWAAQGTRYDLSVTGPNGFLRSFAGSTANGRAQLDVRAAYDDQRCGITLTISNLTGAMALVRVRNNYTLKTTKRIVPPGELTWKRWSLVGFGGWYDLEVFVDGDSEFRSHLAGHVETGDHSISDPAMGRVELADPDRDDDSR